jgi:hypothetical protein
MSSKQRLILLKKIAQTPQPETKTEVPESEAEAFADKVFDQIWDQAINDMLAKAE